MFFVILNAVKNLTRVHTHLRMRPLIALILLGMTVWGGLAFPTLLHAQISSDLQGEIRGLGQQAAVFGLGESAAANIDIRLYVLRMVKVMLGLLGLVLIIMILYGGALYLTSNGMEEKMETGKKVITRAVIGTAIILSAYGITAFISRQLLKAIYTQMITQAQNCDTATGQATCCNEWNAYQAAQTNISSLSELSGTGSGAVYLGTLGQAGSSGQPNEEVDRAYDNWQACFERETDRAGLDSNLFD